MGFVEDVCALPYNVIDKASFTSRTICLTFKNGHKMNATCSEGKDGLDLLKSTMIKKLGKDNVEIHDN